MGRLGEIREAFPLALHLAEAVRMIGVFVRNQDAVEVIGLLPAQRFKSPQHFFFA